LPIVANNFHGYVRTAFVTIGSQAQAANNNLRPNLELVALIHHQEQSTIRHIPGPGTQGAGGRVAVFHHQGYLVMFELAKFFHGS